MKGKHEEEQDKEKKPGGWSVANIAITVTLFIAVTVALLVLERPTVSYTEKRPLATFPDFSFEKLFSGEYTDGITEWFDDTVPWRDGFKDISANIIKNMGVSLGGVTIYGMPSEVVNAPAPDKEPEPSAAQNTGEVSGAHEKTEVPAVTENTETAAAEAAVTSEPFEVGAAQDMSESNGYLVYKNPDDGRYYGIVLYAGGYNEDNFIKNVNDFVEELGDGIQTYVMIAPTSGGFYTPSNYAGYNASQKADLDYIAAGLSDNIISVDCITPLSQHLAEPIYCRTDHHWQPLGAYYAAEAFAQAAGVPFADISSFEERHVPGGFLGTIYAETMSADLLNDPDDFVYYVPSNDYTAYYYDTAYNLDNIYPFFLNFDQELYPGSAYSTFMGADNKIVRVETDVDNGRVLAVFKDSYGNAEIPFYMNSFQEIYVLDVRYFDLNAIDFLKEHGVTDLLFTLNIHSAAGMNADCIEKLRTQ